MLIEPRAAGWAEEQLMAGYSLNILHYTYMWERLVISSTQTTTFLFCFLF